MMEDPNKKRIEEALSSIPAEWRDTVLSDFLNFFRKEFAENVEAHDAVFRDWDTEDGYIAIHDEDLKLIGEVSAVCGTIFAQSPNVGVAIGSILVLAYRYLRKRIRLSADQAIVVSAIKETGSSGIDLDKLRSAMPNNLKEEALFKETIEDLKNLRKVDGTKANIVEVENNKIFSLDI